MTETAMHHAAAAVETAGRVHPAQGRKNSSVIKRSVIRNGHKSSISLEDQFWDALREIAEQKDMAISTLVAAIDPAARRSRRRPPSLACNDAFRQPAVVDMKSDWK